MLAQTHQLNAGALTTLNADGTFSTKAGRASISGTVDAESGTVRGTLTGPSGAETSFSGLLSTIAQTDRLINLSSRMRIGSGVGGLITGFVIGGTEPKTVLVRGIGPTLTAFGLQRVLADPLLRLYRGSEIITQNDDWSAGSDPTALAAAFGRVGAFALAPRSGDTALLITLAPGAYTAHVLSSDATGPASVALIEIYDASVNPNSEYQRLVNISTRGEVTAGEGVLIGGFIITGNFPKRVLIRGVGPGLTALGVPGVLADPRVRLFRGVELLGENDDWSAVEEEASALSKAARATGAFALVAGSKDAALLFTLTPGAYTAQINATDPAATGEALIEIYELPP